MSGESVFGTYEPKSELCRAVQLREGNLLQIADELSKAGYDVTIGQSIERGPSLTVHCADGNGVTARPRQYIVMGRGPIEVVDYFDFRKKWRTERAEQQRNA